MLLRTVIVGFKTPMPNYNMGLGDAHYPPTLSKSGILGWCIKISLHITIKTSTIRRDKIFFFYFLLFSLLVVICEDFNESVYGDPYMLVCSQVLLFLKWQKTKMTIKLKRKKRHSKIEKEKER